MAKLLILKHGALIIDHPVSSNTKSTGAQGKIKTEMCNIEGGGPS